MIEYKGYIGSVDYDGEAGIFMARSSTPATLKLFREKRSNRSKKRSVIR